MPLTRSNRMGDWKQLMGLKVTARSNTDPVSKKEHKKQLATLITLPTVSNECPRSAGPSTLSQLPRNSNKLLDTSSYEPTETPIGFQLPLLSHQKRGLTWMLSVEDVNNPILVETENKKNFRIFGGIVADRPGTGKSVLMIALIKMNPCSFFFEDGGANRIRSKATLLLCPRNIVDQWTNEFRRCDPSIQVLQITTVRRLYDVTSLEVALADVIILPYYILADSNYMGNAIHIETLNPPSLRSYDDLVQYHGILTRFHFHRIVYDEVHEIYDQTRNQEYPFVPFMETFHSNWRWGLTGTPPRDAELFKDVLNCIARADLESNTAIKELKAQIVRSNNPDLGIPGLTQEIKWIDLSRQELAVYNLFRHSSTHAQLMACSHFNVNDIPIHSLDLHEGMTIDEVSEKLQTEHAKKVEYMTNNELPYSEVQVEKLKIQLAELRSRYDAERDREVKEAIQEVISHTAAKLRKHQAIVARCIRDIPRLATEINYFTNILHGLESGEEKVCPICLDEFEEGADTIGLTACGHAFCIDCLAQLGDAPCPNCRAPITQKSIMRIKLTPEGEPDNFSETFGSKINQLVTYIGTQLSIDSTFKFIIFVQYSKLAMLATKALLQFEINSINLAGAVSGRSKALHKFETEDYPVLVMSAEQSVSGANIVTASHVVIFHPFNLGTDEESIAAEEQGIARAHRFGQTRPVRVVRFVTRGTIEERITRGRIGAQYLSE